MFSKFFSDHSAYQIFVAKMDTQNKKKNNLLQKNKLLIETLMEEIQTVILKETEFECQDESKKRSTFYKSGS